MFNRNLSFELMYIRSSIRLYNRRNFVYLIWRSVEFSYCSSLERKSRIDAIRENIIVCRYNKFFNRKRYNMINAWSVLLVSPYLFNKWRSYELLINFLFFWQMIDSTLLTIVYSILHIIFPTRFAKLFAMSVVFPPTLNLQIEITLIQWS